MIAQLTGRCAHLDTEMLVLDVNGVGYLLRGTTGVLQSASRDAQMTVYVHTNVREDAIQLFGFGSYAEQQTFERLLSLQGVGPKVAMSIVSAYSPADIKRAAEHEDVALFQSISGIGPKVARRIVTELRDKLADLPFAAMGTTFTATIADEGFYDARDALIELGLSLQAAEAALRQTDEEATLDERVKQALQVVRA